MLFSGYCCNINGKVMKILHAVDLLNVVHFHWICQCGLLNDQINWNTLSNVEEGETEHQLPKAVTLPLPFNHNPDAQPNGGVTLPSAMQRFG